jgi:hypothetical protein
VDAPFRPFHALSLCRASWCLSEWSDAVSQQKSRHGTVVVGPGLAKTIDQAVRTKRFSGLQAIAVARSSHLDVKAPIVW